MTRADFLQKLGLGAAFVLTVPCLHSCGDDDEPMLPPTGPVDFTIDLNETRASNLQTPGLFIVRDRVVIARTLDGGYAAATLVCSHEDNEAVTYSSAGEWFCGVHGAQFDQDSGASLNSVTSNPLTIYQTALNSDETELRVFS